MNIMDYIKGDDYFIKLQNKDNKISSSLQHIKFEEITNELAFEILKLFLGSDNPNYDKLSIDYLTFVKPAFGQTNIIRYVYDWGINCLIQLCFFKDERDNVYFSASFMS